MQLYTCAGTILCSYALVPLYMHNCTHLCSCTVMQSCVCALVHAPLHYRIPLCSHALVRLCLHNCTQLCIRAFVLALSCAVVQLCTCALAHALNYAVMQLYACTFVRLCRGSRVGKARKRSLAVPAYMMVMPNRTLPTCFPCRTCQEPREVERPARHD